jgi:hypothetical protein
MRRLSLSTRPFGVGCQVVELRSLDTVSKPVCLYLVFCRRYLSALRTAAASAGKQLVGFERYLRLRNKGGNHTHINTLAISELLCCPISTFNCFVLPALVCLPSLR